MPLVLYNVNLSIYYYNHNSFSACQPFGLGRIYEQKTSALELLLLHKANPNTEDHERNAPLNCAYSRNADISDIQCLLKAGADPLHKGKDGYNAYEQALQKGIYTDFGCFSIILTSVISFN